MYKEKQIDEKHELLESIYMSGHGLDRKDSDDIAEQLYHEGYRKQREGEWIKTETNYTCSKCNFNVISWSGEYDGYECERGISLMKFCPNCGARMKGGE